MGRLDFCKTPLLLIWIASFLFFGCAKEEASVVGGKAADFSLKDLNGEAISLSQFQGQVVIIVFGASWCNPCNAYAPHLIDLYGKYRERGVTILEILLDQAPTSYLSKFIAEKGINFPVVLGSEEVIEVYRVYQIPVTIVVDKEGIMRERLLGFSDTLIGRLEERIKELI